MQLKECPYVCPKCGQGDLAGGGAIACRYTCGHVIKRGELPDQPDVPVRAEKSVSGSRPFTKKELAQGYRKGGH